MYYTPSSFITVALIFSELDRRGASGVPPGPRRGQKKPGPGGISNKRHRSDKCWSDKHRSDKNRYGEAGSEISTQYPSDKDPCDDLLGSEAFFIILLYVFFQGGFAYY